MDDRWHVCVCGALLDPWDPPCRCSDPSPPIAAVVLEVMSAAAERRRS